MGDQAAATLGADGAPAANGTNGNGTARWVAEGGHDTEGDADDDHDDDDSGPAGPPDNDAQ